MEQQVHSMLAGTCGVFACSSKTLTSVFLEVSYCCSDPCSPSGPVTRRILKLPGLEACPLKATTQAENHGERTLWRSEPMAENFFFKSIMQWLSRGLVLWR
jgi:hypothetical protein